MQNSMGDGINYRLNHVDDQYRLARTIGHRNAKNRSSFKPKPLIDISMNLLLLRRDVGIDASRLARLHDLPDHTRVDGNPDLTLFDAEGRFSNQTAST